MVPQKSIKYRLSIGLAIYTLAIVIMAVILFEIVVVVDFILSHEFFFLCVFGLVAFYGVVLWVAKTPKIIDKVTIKNPLTFFVETDMKYLPKTSRLIDTFAEKYHLPDEKKMHLHLSLEELLTMIIYYGYSDHDTHKISVSLNVVNQHVHVAIENDGPAYNPLDHELATRKDALEFDDDWEGLGINIIKDMVTDVRYERVQRRNKIQFSV